MIVSRFNRSFILWAVLGPLMILGIFLAAYFFRNNRDEGFTPQLFGGIFFALAVIGGMIALYYSLLKKIWVVRIGSGTLELQSLFSRRELFPTDLKEMKLDSFATGFNFFFTDKNAVVMETFDYRQSLFPLDSARLSSIGHTARLQGGKGPGHLYAGNHDDRILQKGICLRSNARQGLDGIARRIAQKRNRDH